MAEGFGKNLAWCVIVIAIAVVVNVPAATAGRFVIKNEIQGAKGLYRILSVKCWSKDDNLGPHQILPGRSKSWEFKTVDYWPFTFTEFRCTFRTGFGTTRDDDVVVFEARYQFLQQCDNPAGQECIWVAKRDGLYLRSQILWLEERHYKDVLRSKWNWGW